MTEQDYKGNEELSEDEAEVLFKIRKKAKKAESKLKERLAASVVIPQLNELIDKAESERPVVNHFDIPVYLKTVKEARELGEIDLFTRNENENRSCRDFISKTVTENYRGYDSGYGGAFNSDATLKQIMKEYPLDRIALILASRVSAADWDKRFTDRVHKWAKATLNPLPVIRL